jgi:hypothetical protein
VAVLVFVLMNMMEIVIIISVSVGMVMPSFMVNASALILRTMFVVVPRLLMMFINMNVRVVVKINAVPPNTPATLVISPKMIFPPVIKRIKESFLMQKP